MITIRESGAREIPVEFRHLEGWVSDLRPVWPKVSEYFHEIEEQAYRTEGASQGKKWAALSDRPPGKGYATRKAALFARRPILYLTGLLHDSLTGGEGSRKISKRLRYTEESTVPYAIYHATGTSRMPRRPPVSITEQQAREFGAIIGRYINANIRKSFATVGA